MTGPLRKVGRGDSLIEVLIAMSLTAITALGIIGSGLATTLSQTLMCALLLASSLIDPRVRFGRVES